MRFKPPPADPRKQKEEEKRRQRKAALIPVLFAVALILGIAAFTYFQKESAPVVRRPLPGELALMSNVPGLTGDMMGGMPLGPTFSDEPRPQNATGLMLLHPGDDPFDAEPAELAAFPADKKTRIAGIVRDAEGIGEQMVFWSVAATPDEVMSHYKAQAEKAGFTALRSKPVPLTSATATQPAATQPSGKITVRSALTPSTTQLFFRQLGEKTPETPADKRGPQSLIVRITPQPDGTQRVLLWLRYSSPRKRSLSDSR